MLSLTSCPARLLCDKLKRHAGPRHLSAAVAVGHRNELQLQYAKKVNPTDTSFLLKTKNEHGISMWDSIQAFKSSYNEKGVLVNPEVARKVAHEIDKNSRAGELTAFVDADGGLCLVTKQLMKMDKFRHPFMIWEREKSFDALYQQHRQDFSQPFEVLSINLIQSLLDLLFRKMKGRFKTELVQAMRTLPSLQCSDPQPNYTMFATVSHGFLKYLAFSYLLKDDLDFSLFQKGRPEFFFLVTPRTLRIASLQLRRHYSSKNVLLGLMFDIKCLMSLQREAFLPWKVSYSRLDMKEKDKLYLIQVRPKADIGLLPGVSRAHFAYFVNTLYKLKNQPFIAIVEKWIPGIGLHYVRQGLVTSYTQITELNLEQLPALFNVFAINLQLHTSSFGMEVQRWLETQRY